MFKVNEMVKVELKNETIKGKIVEIAGANNDIIYVKSGNDILKFFVGVNKIEKLDNVDLFLGMLEEAGYEISDGYGTEDGAEYVLSGFTYDLLIVINANENIFECSTKHNGIDNNDYNNIATRKTLKGVMGYINKWINK